MLTEEQIVDKLRGMARQFDQYAKNKEPQKAAWQYLKAEILISELQLGPKVREELFGESREDVEEEYELKDGLFARNLVRKVNWECCVLRHKTYQDIACRKLGQPVKFYSDVDYCALCDKRTKK